MDQSKTMDFIEMLEDRPQLWQKEHGDFCNKELRARLLEEVAEELGVTAFECKKKLKNLKDRMRMCLQQLPWAKKDLPADELAASCGTRWCFFKQLLFMKDQFISPPELSMESADELEAVLEGCVEECDDAQVVLLSSADQHPSSSLRSSSARKSSANKRAPSFQPRKAKSRRTEKEELSEDDDRAPRFASSSAEMSTNIKLRSRLESEKALKRARLESNGAYDAHDSITIPRAPTSSNGEEYLAQALANLERTIADNRYPKRDEWQTFCDSICSDLRKLTDPFIIMEVKNDIHRVVNEGVRQQLQKDASRALVGHATSSLHPKSEMI